MKERKILIGKNILLEVGLWVRVAYAKRDLWIKLGKLGKVHNIYKCINWRGIKDLWLQNREHVKERDDNQAEL